MASARVLVTGGAGFIGSHLTEALLREGARVRILDDFSSGKDENIRHIRPDVEVAVADLRDGDAVRHAPASRTSASTIFAIAPRPSWYLLACLWLWSLRSWGTAPFA